MKTFLAFLAMAFAAMGLTLALIFLTCVIAVTWVHTEAARDGAGRWTSEPDNPSGFHRARHFEWIKPAAEKAHD